jgi:hypothetical protein
MHINPDPALAFTEDSELILIGTGKAQTQLFEMYPRVNKVD